MVKIAHITPGAQATRQLDSRQKGLEETQPTRPLALKVSCCCSASHQRLFLGTYNVTVYTILLSHTIIRSDVSD